MNPDRREPIPWLGVLPSHWKIVRGRFLFRQRALPPSPEDRVVTAFRDGQVTLRENRRTDGFMVAEKELGYQHVSRGDLVIHGMDAFAGAVGVSESDGKCTPEYVVLAPWKPGTSNAFFSACLRQMAAQDFIRVICPSVRERAPRFRYETFKDVALPVPSVVEQAQIVLRLESQLAAIDRLITYKERMLELLAERQQAIVVQAVTKGVKSSRPLKSSGIGWLGEIPGRWTVVRTRFLCSLTTGSRDTQDAKEDGEYPFFVRSDNVERIDSYSFDGEGVLTSGDGAGVGKVFHHHLGKLEFHQRVYLYHSFKGILGRFFYYYLRELLSKVVLAGNAKSTVDSLRRPMLQDFPVTVPPLDEQREIVAYLDRSVSENMVLRKQVLRQLELLREYRRALVSAAVNGQLDLSEEAA